MPTPHAVLGIDACGPGWVGIRWDGVTPQGVFGTTIAALISAATSIGRVEVIGVDIPIGLPDSTAREADALARRFIQPRGSSVFTTPVRTSIEAADYVQAVAINRAALGLGISKQSHALRTKVLEVDLFVRTTELTVVEVHPEVSFAEINGGGLPESKKTWAGSQHRRRLLAAQGMVIDGDLGLAGRKAAVDDVLDAGAAAWTAMRVLRGTAISLPATPEKFSDGWQAAIWR